MSEQLNDNTEEKEDLPFPNNNKWQMNENLEVESREENMGLHLERTFLERPIPPPMPEFLQHGKVAKLSQEIERKLTPPLTSSPKLVSLSPLSLHPSGNKTESRRFETLLHRPRPTLLHIGSIEDDFPEVFLRKESPEEFVRRRLDYKGWTSKQPPTTNPFLLYALCHEENPWTFRNLHSISPKQISNSLESVYCSARSLNKSLRFHPKKGDVIVNGVIRCGQTPFLHCLAMLKYGKIIQKENLLSLVDWIEASNQPSPQTPTNSGNRLIKSHLPLRTCFGGVISPSPRGCTPEFRVIVVLRNPYDIRLSWFRHLRRVFKKFNPLENFDAYFDFEDFKDISLYASNPHVSPHFPVNLDYENYVAEIIKPAFYEASAQIHVFFYEEFLLEPLKVVKKLAEITGFSETNNELHHQISEYLMKDENFPIGFASADRMRHGSSGQGRASFDPRTISKLEVKWRDTLLKYSTRSNFSDYDSLVFKTSTILQRPPKLISRSMMYQTSKTKPAITRGFSFTNFFQHPHEEDTSFSASSSSEDQHFMNPIYILFPTTADTSIIGTSHTLPKKRRSASLSILSSQSSSKPRAGTSYSTISFEFDGKFDPDDSDEEDGIHMFVQRSRTRRVRRQQDGVH